MRQSRSETRLSHQEVTDLMLPAAIDAAAQHAERAYLCAFGEPAGRADAAVTSCICDMLAETHEIADALDATPAQRQHLEASRTAVFDRRLDELRAFAVPPRITR